MGRVDELIELRESLKAHLQRLRNLRKIPTFTRETIQRKRQHAERLLSEAAQLERDLETLDVQIPDINSQLELLNTQIISLQYAAKIERWKRLMAEKERLQ